MVSFEHFPRTRDGARASVVAPGALAAPQAIVAGADGRLWVTFPNKGEHAHALLAISAEEATLGQMTLYDLPSPDSAPGAIAADAAGNLWITHAEAAMITRMTPAGKATEFPLAAPAAGATSTSTIDLSWVDRSNDEERFTVQMSRGGAGFLSVVTTLPANSTFTTVTKLEEGTTYSFRVRAHNAAWASPVSNEASATPGGGRTYSTSPASPTSRGSSRRPESGPRARASAARRPRRR